MQCSTVLLCVGQTRLMLWAAVGIGCVGGACAAWMKRRPVTDEQKHRSWSAMVRYPLYKSVDHAANGTIVRTYV